MTSVSNSLSTQEHKKPSENLSLHVIPEVYNIQDDATSVVEGRLQVEGSC